MMGGLDVGVEAGLARPYLEHRDGAQVGQVVEGLVHGLERDVRHLVPDPLVHPLGRRMGHVALEGAEDALALGRDLATVGPEEIGQSVGRLHAIVTIAVAPPISTIVVRIARAPDRAGPQPPGTRPVRLELAHGEERPQGNPLGGGHVGPAALAIDDAEGMLDHAHLRRAGPGPRAPSAPPW